MVNEHDGLNEKPNKKFLLIAAMVGVLVAIIALVVWVFLPDQPVEPTVATPGIPQQTVPEPEPEPEPVVEQSAPVEQEPSEPEQPPEEPLPALGESDEPVLKDLDSTTQSDALSQRLTRDNVILKSVRAILALEEGTLVNKYRPISPPDTPFTAEPIERADADAPQQFILSDESYQRYDDYINMLVHLNTSQLVGLYNRYYPLLEQAYQEQGVDKGEFRDVTLAAIDQLLAAPIIEEDIKLVRPSVMYKFADPQLEALPGAHKLMLRIGPDNARALKDVLRKLRAELE